MGEDGVKVLNGVVMGYRLLDASEPESWCIHSRESRKARSVSADAILLLRIAPTGKTGLQIIVTCALPS